MHYSPCLIKNFQNQYRESFGLEISEEEADFELHRLARLLEIALPAIFMEERSIDE